MTVLSSPVRASGHDTLDINLLGFVATADDAEQSRSNNNHDGETVGITNLKYRTTPLYCSYDSEFLISLNCWFYQKESLKMENSNASEEEPPMPKPQALEDGDSSPEDNQDDEVTQSLPPSHILEDGRFIYLPPPDTLERSRFFERSIARHGLLESDMMGKKKMVEEVGEDGGTKDGDDEKKEDSTTPKVHPLAVASARLQSNGLSELNRAINLAGLVNAGEYFGLTNIVDPSLEIEAGNDDATSRPASGDVLEQQKVKATYILKRKRTQFEKASAILGRHEKRLKAAIAAQSVVEQAINVFARWLSG